MATTHAIQENKLNWALIHLNPALLATPEDCNLLAHLREIHKTKPIAEMWPCFQERLMGFYNVQTAYDLLPT